MILSLPVFSFFLLIFVPIALISWWYATIANALKGIFLLLLLNCFAVCSLQQMQDNVIWCALTRYCYYFVDDSFAPSLPHHFNMGPMMMMIWLSKWNFLATNLSSFTIKHCIFCVLVYKPLNSLVPRFIWLCSLCATHQHESNVNWRKCKVFSSPS